jgi:hypothetical protein
LSNIAAPPPPAVPEFATIVNRRKSPVTAERPLNTTFPLTKRAVDSVTVFQ